jgi:hypothetical protein
MTEGSVERRLSAILVADVAGYRRLMGENEESTLDALKILVGSGLLQGVSNLVLTKLACHLDQRGVQFGRVINGF